MEIWDADLMCSNWRKRVLLNLMAPDWLVGGAEKVNYNLTHAGTNESSLTCQGEGQKLT